MSVSYRQKNCTQGKVICVLTAWLKAVLLCTNLGEGCELRLGKLTSLSCPKAVSAVQRANAEYYSRQYAGLYIPLDAGIRVQIRIETEAFDYNTYYVELSDSHSIRNLFNIFVHVAYTYFVLLHTQSTCTYNGINS